VVAQFAELDGSKEPHNRAISLGPLEKGSVSVNLWTRHPLIPLEALYLEERSRFDRSTRLFEKLRELRARRGEW
jgi:hypothetical protein